jgi:hypothetical protein
MYEGGVAQLVNLIINMNLGVINYFEWSNGCYTSNCGVTNCIQTGGNYSGAAYSETNCYYDGCTANNTACDTKVYVTWTGNDINKKVCVSDNYRISHFTQYSITSLVQSAISLV